jgi:hypothetical protein
MHKYCVILLFNTNQLKNVNTCIGFFVLWVLLVERHICGNLPDFRASEEGCSLVGLFFQAAASLYHSKVTLVAMSVLSNQQNM